MAGKTLDTSKWKRNKASKAALDKFDESFKKDMGFGGTSNDDYDVVSTGSLNIDYALTVGGVPSGRVIEVWGPEHAGKTTICMLMVAQFQAAYPDQRCAWVDMEQTFDPAWAASLGVDVKALYRPPVKTAEDTADATKRIVESGLFSLVILDSIGGMIAKKEFEKEAEDATVGLVAKIVTRMVKQCAPMAKSNGTTVCVVNQVRANIGGYGASETKAGGWALKHVTTMVLNVKRGGLPHTITKDGAPFPVGHEMVVKIQKNKMGPYGQTARVWLHNVVTDKYGPIGVDVAQETFDFAKRMKLLGTKQGRYLMPDGETEIVGEPKTVDRLREHDEWRNHLRGKILASLAGLQTDEGDTTGDDEVDFDAAMVGGEQ